ncbi:efflux transporter outer membrane subunit [Sandaracinobacter sp. RS1-74]|uniref:efflux transporter outer membrane subunit n=1 Tax=Sandaracinobacteroides sayramensis TaxID=2913411 RepID=UPI001EDA9420|nr:efflux transporter outer membrane subunit [Sandaracinobacteroides sayramensis]MCG2841452.1 efflux transporter outer membrane subunit [Sandaracinobacteroides sayramensis]
MRSNASLLAALLAGTLLAGCSLAPKHVRPVAAVESGWREPAAAGGVAATSIGYADYFPDDRLKALIALGLEHNRDLAVSTARIAEARGLYGIQRADQLPGLAAQGSYARSRTASDDAGGQGAITGSRQAVGVTVPGFELDFWGRVRNLSEAARSQYLATEAGDRSARLAMVRSIATAYWQERETDERLALAEATVKSRNEGVRIAGQRLDAGVTSALDYRQAQSLLTQAETELAALKLARSEAHNLLVVLVGGPIPETLPRPLPLAGQKPDHALAEGLPSGLLEARPDILAAEEQLRAARANVGAARAAFFPQIALTGSLGYASGDLDSLFHNDGFNWSFGPSISVPLFDWGRRKGNVDVAVARTDIAVATYEKTVQEAFREVADALAGRRYLAEEVEAQQRATEAQREIARLAQIRYREGVANYLEVLDAERNLFTAEQALLSLRRLELSNLAALYAALGGGLSPAS